MYKTAVITDEISQNLSEAAALARQFRLDALEIRSVNERNPFQMTREDYAAVKKIADDAGLKICAVSSPLFKIDKDNLAMRGAHIEAFKRTIEAMKLWNCKLIRGFTFMNLGDGADSFQEIADIYQEIADLAADADVTVVIESEPSVTTRNIFLLSRFLKIADSPNIQAVFDPGNEIADADQPAPYPDGYQLLKPYIRHVHVKDIRRVPGSFVPAMLGEGDVDFTGIFKALKKDRYEGYASCETHFRIRSKVSDEDLVHPQGASFSEGGYEATRAYLTALRDIYHWQEED